MMQRIGAGERRARLGRRHRLAGGARAGDPADVARALVAVHSTDPSSVYLSLLARMAGGDIGSVDRALYEDRTLIRLLGMRRTVFVTALDIAPLIQAACSRAVAAQERRKVLGYLAESGVGDDVDGWLAGVEQAALTALTARGEATAAELAGDDPRLQVQIVLARLFDRNGNVGPTLWWDGRIVGGWAQDRDGEIVCRFLEDAGSDAVAAVDAAARRMAGTLGTVRLTARTRGMTWLEQELAG
jgi:DNA glycosylase AlkZ-like